MKDWSKWTIGAVGVLVGITSGVLVSCSSTHQDGPDPTAANTHPGTREGVILEPDGFRNVVYSCNGPDMVYVASRGQTSDVISSGIAVIGNDPLCR